MKKLKQLGNYGKTFCCSLLIAFFADCNQQCNPKFHFSIPKSQLTKIIFDLQKKSPEISPFLPSSYEINDSLFTSFYYHDTEEFVSVVLTKQDSSNSEITLISILKDEDILNKEKKVVVNCSQINTFKKRIIEKIEVKVK